MQVLIINGHPRHDSFSEAIVNAYFEGAVSAGVQIRKLSITDLRFNPNVITASPNDQDFEKDISEAQQLIQQADHIVFVYPTWWGTMPALLKGFFDRVLTAGFAFHETEGGTGYEPLLRGRSAQLITTMDTPLWVYRWIYGAPGHRAMRHAILGFCGFSPVKVIQIGVFKKTTEEERKKWLDKVRAIAASLKEGPISRASKLKSKITAWLRAIRLQFYPMTFVAYLAGALAASSDNYIWNKTAFWLGYLWIFFLEVTTVLSNDYFDYRSDKQNNFYGPFTGGSRVLVEKRLSNNEMRTGIISSLLLSFIPLTILFTNFPALINTPVLLICLALFVLALGYTIPPLKLSYRGLGEITVGITHSFSVILCGYIFQQGYFGDPLPWLISVPLFFSILPSIILAGVPDREADKAAGKKTLAVRLGSGSAAKLALIFTWLAAIIVLVIKESGLVNNVYSNLIYIVIPHAVWLTIQLLKFIGDPQPTKRIDGLLVLALTYLIWFGLIPVL